MGEEIAIVTTKGEAVALGISLMGQGNMSTTDHGAAARIKRVIMERDLYPRRWGLGPTAVKKKTMKSAGQLDKFGRANENTPAEWKHNYRDVMSMDYSMTMAPRPGAASMSSTNAVGGQPVPSSFQQQLQYDEKPQATVNGEVKMEADHSKKRKRHDDETPEERAERKKKKAEKKAHKEEKHKHKAIKAERTSA